MKDDDDDDNNNNIQRRAIRHEFESVGPTLFEDFLAGAWGLLPTLRRVGSWFFRQVLEGRFHNEELNCQPLRSDLGASPLSFGRLGSS